MCTPYFLELFVKCIHMCVLFSIHQLYWTIFSVVLIMHRFSSRLLRYENNIMLYFCNFLYVKVKLCMYLAQHSFSGYTDPADDSSHFMNNYSEILAT